MARAASINSFPLMARVDPLANLAIRGVMAAAMAMTILISPGPMMAKTRSPRMTMGKDMKMSMNRRTRLSTIPPLKPPIMPRGMPAAMANRTESVPTTRDTLDPHRILDS